MSTFDPSRPAMLHDCLTDRVMRWDPSSCRDYRSNAAPYALRAIKECVDRGIETDLETGLAIERQQFASVFATEDRAIGMQSFIENGPGKARFEGR